MTVLTPADYPQIRAAIDATLTPKTLPDSTIAMDIYSGRAEDWVQAHSPAAYAAYVDPPATPVDVALHRAAIFATAALIATAQPLLVTETFGGQYSYRRNERDPATLVGDLWTLANEQIGLAGGETPVPQSPGGGKPFFTLAYGGRGR
jgi:endonuclease/exonuclease/phosphatase (EEP) superfamily protein YafD